MNGSMGSGEVEYTAGVSIIHFGSPIPAASAGEEPEK